MKKTLLGLALIGWSTQLFAQTENDVLRYGYLSPGGTARGMSLGGAMGSVGADITSASVNPAGIGLYRRSELTFTPSLYLKNTKSDYNGGPEGKDNYTKFNFNNLGLVLSSASWGRNYEKSKWKAFNFAIGMNRQADYHQQYYYSGNNYNSSISDVWVNEINAQGKYLVNYDGSSLQSLVSPAAYMAFQNYLIDPRASDSTVFTNAPVHNQSPVSATGILQRKTSTSTGAYREMVLSVGANYDEKLLLGATVGIPSIRYTQDFTFQEDDLTGDQTNAFGFNDYRSIFTTTGTGINLKLGAIVIPTDMIRIGVAIHTPTWFGMEDTYQEEMQTNSENNPSNGGRPINSMTSDPGIYNYNMSTPWRGIVSGTVLLGEYGFLTADYEYVDYKATRYRFQSEDRQLQNDVNDAIRGTYKSASNFRVGAEGRLDMFAVRLGGGFYGNPYQKYSNNTRIDISGGIGMRTQDFLIDFAVVSSTYNQPDQPYVLPNTMVPTANIRNSNLNFMLTFGLRF
jgi:hypothetical protein